MFYRPRTRSKNRTHQGNSRNHGESIRECVREVYPLFAVDLGIAGRSLPQPVPAFEVGLTGRISFFYAEGGLSASRHIRRFVGDK